MVGTLEFLQGECDFIKLLYRQSAYGNRRKRKSVKQIEDKWKNGNSTDHEESNMTHKVDTTGFCVCQKLGISNFFTTTTTCIL